MNFQHFSEMPYFKFQHFQKMPEIHFTKNARNYKSTFDLSWTYMSWSYQKFPDILNLIKHPFQIHQVAIPKIEFEKIGDVTILAKKYLL